MVALIRPLDNNERATYLDDLANVVRGVHAGNWDTLDAADASRLSDVAVALTKLAQEARDG